MHQSLDKLITWAWLTIGAVWLITAFATKQTARIQSIGSRLIHSIPLILAFVLIFDSDTAVGLLGRTFVSSTPFSWFAGAALTIAGILFAIWARFFLGGNWSSAVTIKEDHQLIRGGPYAVVRHPIYSGFLLAILGTAIFMGQFRGLFGLGLAIAGLKLKSLYEESFMEQQFGADYQAYKRQVKSLIPFVW